jgi:hypothetical protein
MKILWRLEYCLRGSVEELSFGGPYFEKYVSSGPKNKIVTNGRGYYKVDRLETRLVIPLEKKMIWKVVATWKGGSGEKD